MLVDGVTIAIAVLIATATVMLAVVVVQALLARAALRRLAQMQVATTQDLDARPPDSLRSCVRSYSVVVDLRSTANVSLAMGGPPPEQQESALFACGDALESLVGTYTDLAWVAVQPSSADADALYEDVANERVRYLMLAGTYVRAWAWKESSGRRGLFNIATAANNQLQQVYPTESRSLASPAPSGHSMPGVESGTVILVIARIDSLAPPTAAGMPSTSSCRRDAPSSSPVPIELPIVQSGDARTAWNDLVHSTLSKVSGTFPVHVWGFGGRVTF